MNKYRYIVIEDEDLICQNIIKKAEALNLQLEFAGSADDGEQALSLIDKEVPNIVLTDIRMPVMDGLMLSKELYFAYPSIQIIIISGYDEFDYARQAIKFGVSDFLLKPLDSDELHSSLLKAIARLDSNKSKLFQDNNISQSMSKAEVADYVETFIKENYKNNISLNELADSLGFSSDYISKVFKKEKNITPIKFITKLRIYEAKLLLTTTNLDLLCISQLIGYTDQFYFSRVFKAQVGEYPSEYRANNS